MVVQIGVKEADSGKQSVNIYLARGQADGRGRLWPRAGAVLGSQNMVAISLRVGELLKKEKQSVSISLPSHSPARIWGGYHPEPGQGPEGGGASDVPAGSRRPSVNSGCATFPPSPPRVGTESAAMAALGRSVRRLTNSVESKAFPLLWPGLIRLKFTKTRIPAKMFEVKPADHEKYNGDPDQPHQLHIITRIKCTKRRPYWEKKIVHDLGLDKSNQPQIHKNVPSVNSKLKVIKHLIRVQPLKLPQGLPTEQELADTYLKSTGELIIRRHLQPLNQISHES